MDRITFSVNRNQYSVGSEVNADTSLNDYVRNVLNLRGTKYMCKEGGCGACVVAVTIHRGGEKRTFSVNSCMVTITSCQDWEITTIEGVGNRGKGYHPVQKTLAEYNGTQCGYCSPGFVMSMYSLLEANDYKLSQYEIENSFGSNTCRCTGYRPILDAFKSFAKDAPKPVTKHVHDIEDLSALRCGKNEKCDDDCNSWCFVDEDDVKPKIVLKINLKDDRVWYRVNEVEDIFDVFEKEGLESYMLVNGNTGRGAVPITTFPRVLIDISPVEELKNFYIDQNLVIGAGFTLTDLMTLFKRTAEKEDFSYMLKLYEHLDLVAHIPIRNIGTVAGNLMLKHRQPTFSSDVFLLLETVGAILAIVGKDKKIIQVTPQKFLSLDMKGKVIFQIKLPPLSKRHKFVSFKIMPRAQNAHAQVNAAFLYEFDPCNSQTVLHAKIVIGGLSAGFVHAKNTEKYLLRKKIFTNEVLQAAIKVLDAELIVDYIPGEMKPEFRRKCALGLFYKGLLVLIPKSLLKPIYQSGARDYRKTRPLSKGTDIYDTNPIIWPINEPMPKVDALIQCAGESKYVNDLTTEAKEVFCAFVTSDISTGEILDIDPAPALEMPGVFAFFSAKDIPGKNNCMSQKMYSQNKTEKIFAENTVKYFNQPIGVIVAETEILAHQAALLVKAKYKAETKKPLLKIKDVRKREPDRVVQFRSEPAKDRGSDVHKVIKGTDNIFAQCHFPMETIQTVCRPNELGIDVFASTQYMNNVQEAISGVLNMKQNRINVVVPRCGGAYGLKISRTSQIAAACALVTYLMNRTCRFVLGIKDSLRVVGKRLPCTRDFEVGVSASGEIQYMDYNLYMDDGYAVNDPINQFVPDSIKNVYDSTRWKFKIFDVTTDTASNTYCRSPGTLESIAMTEHIMEQIAYEMKLDPIDVRKKNLSSEYPETAEMLETLLEDSEYYKRKKEAEDFNKSNRWKKRGIRIALMSWPVMNLTNNHVQISVYQGDGTVVITHSGIEVGQGINTKIIQTVAHTLKISLDKVRCKVVDAASCPNDVATGTSRTTQAVCFGAIKCCEIILDRLEEVKEASTDHTWEVLIQEAYNKGIDLKANYLVTKKDQEVYRSGGVAVCEVELDILTGEHEVLRVDIIEDVGTSINPELDIGQIEGCWVMGMGYWTHEELIYDDKTGELLTDRTWSYHVPLAKDVPIDFRVQLRRNSYNPVGTLGAKAVAEPPTCLAVSVAFALREALASSRDDTGYPRNKWFNVDGPYTIAANVLTADVKLDEFLFN